MSAMNGWLPNSIVSETGSSAAQNAAGPMAQPLRNPVAAWLFEIEETTTTRSRSASISSGETKSPSKISSA